jgi:hypothetical protein
VIDLFLSSLIKHDNHSINQEWKLGDIAYARENWEGGSVDSSYQIYVKRERDSYQNSYCVYCFKHEADDRKNEFINLANKKKAYLKVDQNF